MRILIVDDDPPTVKWTSFLLRDEGYEVITADNGRAALDLVERDSPDLVIMDVMMPNIDGLEACRRIRRNWIDTTPPLLHLHREYQIENCDINLKNREMSPSALKASNQRFRWLDGC